MPKTYWSSKSSAKLQVRTQRSAAVPSFLTPKANIPPESTPKSSPIIHEQIPQTLKIQPNKSILLCTLCYEYFPICQKEVHIRLCNFDEQNQHQINGKLIKIKQLLQEAHKKNINCFVAAVFKKIARYLNDTADLEDILLMEWFLKGKEVDIGIDWRGVFWAVEQLGGFKEKIHTKSKSQPCLCCH